MIQNNHFAAGNQYRANRQRLRDAISGGNFSNEDTDWLVEQFLLHKNSIPPSAFALSLAKQENPISNEFFTQLVKDLHASAEFLSAILDVSVDVIFAYPQKEMSNLEGLSVRLNAFINFTPASSPAIIPFSGFPLAKSSWAAIELHRMKPEIQTSATAEPIDMQKRARYISSIATVNPPFKSTPFDHPSDLITIIIADYDVLGTGQLVTPVLRIRPDRLENKNGTATGTLMNNGALELYLNLSASADLSNPYERKLGILADLFLTDACHDTEFPYLSARKRLIKNSKELIDTMASEIEMALAERDRDALRGP